MMSSYAPAVQAPPRYSAAMPPSFATTMAPSAPIAKDYQALTILSDTKTMTKLRAPESVHELAPPPMRAVRTALSRPTMAAARQHVCSYAHNCDPWEKPSILEPYRSPNDFFGAMDVVADKVCHFYKQDTLGPRVEHWGWLDGSWASPVIRLFNHEIGREPTWQDHIDSRRLPKVPWVSRFPGVVHNPLEVVEFELDFQLGNQYLLTPKQLLDAFSAVNSLGMVDLVVPADELQALLRTDEIAGQGCVVLHSIEAVEVHSTLPVPVQLQLRSQHPDAGSDCCEWFRCSRNNAIRLKDVGHKDAERKGAGLKAKPAPFTVMPHTNVVGHSLPLFGVAEEATSPEFFRWVNSTEAQVRSVLRTAGQFYEQGTPEVVGVHAIESGAATCVDPNSSDVVSTQVKPACRDVSDLASFLCLDEWVRIQAMAAKHSYPPDHAEISLEAQKFKVHYTLLDPLISEKFQGPMDRSLHVMKVDAPVHLRVSLQTGHGEDRKDGLDRFDRLMRALHPDVAFSGNAASTSTSSLKSIALPNSTAAGSEGAPMYALGVRFKVVCARLESTTVERPYGGVH